MTRLYVIEDQMHAEWIGKHESLTEARRELERLAAIPWGQAPNRAPCTNSADCRRSYDIIEYDTSVEPWAEIRRPVNLEISAEGVVWDDAKVNPEEPGPA